LTDIEIDRRVARGERGPYMEYLPWRPKLKKRKMIKRYVLGKNGFEETLGVSDWAEYLIEMIGTAIEGGEGTGEVKEEKHG